VPRRECLEKLGERRDERVLVADDVAWPPEIAKDGMLQVGDQEIARALLGGGIRRIHEFQVIQALEIEPEHAAGTVNLEPVLILAADPEARRLECAGAPVLEGHERHHGIVHRAAGCECARARDRFDDGPVEVERRIE